MTVQVADLKKKEDELPRIRVAEPLDWSVKYVIALLSQQVLQSWFQLGILKHEAGVD